MCFRQQWSHLKGKNKQISALGQMITRENNFIVTTNVSFSCFYLSQQITTKEKKKKKNEESHITCQKVIFENFSNTEKWRFLVLVMKQLHFKCCDWFYIKIIPTTPRWSRQFIPCYTRLPHIHFNGTLTLLLQSAAGHKHKTLAFASWVTAKRPASAKPHHTEAVTCKYQINGTMAELQGSVFSSSTQI